MPALKEMQEQFVAAMTQADAIREPYDGKSENMSDEEQARYDQFINEADGLMSKIESGLKHDKIRAWSKELPDKFKHGNGRGLDPNMPDAVKRLDELKRKAFTRYLSGIEESVDPVKYYKNTPEYKAYIDGVSAHGTELKAYQADNPAGGGFMVVPQILAAEILTLLKDLLWIRQLGTVQECVNAESLGIVAIDTDPTDADWTSELGTGNEETTMAFGKRELRPYPLAKRLKLSKKLLRQVLNADSVIIDRLLYKAAVAEEKAYVVGDGNQKPLGIMTSGAVGISTARDTTAASASALAADELITTYFTLKPQYRKDAVWMMNRSTLAAVRKLKDSQNNYLWQPGLNGFVAVGTGLIGTIPSTLLGAPVMESEYVLAIAASTYVAAVFSPKFYWIADALNMTIQVLYELYAETNQMGYILRKETDGMPVLEEAFARYIMHS